MSLLFRPIRLIVLSGVAFLKGVFYERSNQQSRCNMLVGVWTPSYLCTMEAGNG